MRFTKIILTFGIAFLCQVAISQAQSVSWPIFTAGITEPSNRAVDFIINGANETEGTPLLFKKKNVSSGDFCQILKNIETGLYISSLSTYRRCYPEMKALGSFDFPFIAKDWADARQVINGPTGLVVSESLIELGVQVLNFWDGETRVFSSNTLIATADDLKDKKVLGPRTFSSTIVIAQNGGTPVTLPGKEVYLALERGLLDAADVPLSLYSTDLAQVQKSVLLSNHSFDPLVVAVPNNSLNSIGTIQRGLLESLVRQATAYQIREAKLSQENSLTMLKERGANVVMMSKAASDSFQTTRLSMASSEKAESIFASVSPALKKVSTAQAQGQPLSPYWKVFFVTNREVANSKFTEKISTNVSYGQAEVECLFDEPINSPAELIGNLMRYASKGNDIAVDWTQVSNIPFPKGLTKVQRSIPTKAPVIYVHGFANTFDDALHRAAWIGWNAKRPVIAFTWPSRGIATPSAYRADQQSADSSLSSLALVLEQLGRDYDTVTDVDIVVHSMGARVLLGALDALEQKSFPVKPPRFRLLVLVAPDIAATKLRQNSPQLAKYFEKMATLYISDHDKALGISRDFMNRQEGSRVGLAPPIVVEKGIESIFIGPNDFSFIGHSYHVSNGIIADDIVELLRYGTSAQERRGSGPSLSGQGYFELRRLKNL